ncbi:MAG: MFS transporter [Bacteroidetes bacterium GWF2_42_66]|nr:MAG: MFS transporter [Bacteroidetes bacterium GWA2_42_15]OFX98244.1 MAG: MFS transporter [Bacteroidetes bacterium GWE2_42_39]OFY42626.1 MAG: MFS transporter [Bacteroidetes bacterium GWF2_42_66]HBL74198.1 MFS transporter [Prolixibacteraceae bacterium]HCR91683.1 MFS transporter [Prolixibacteraceae bacterium]
MKKLLIPYKWELVILLWIAFFFNQADRQIFNIVLPSMRDDLGLTDADMGLIASILILFYGLMVPIGGILGDRINKKYIIIVSLLVWSAATLATGLSYTLIQLILLRSIATGGGEAFYSPSANALICEYHQKTRATAMSIHQTALYVGIIGSGFLTGYIADMFGWRVAFYLFGGFGVLLSGILYFRLKDSLIIRNSEANTVPKKTVKEVLQVFFKKPTAILLTLAFAGMQFTGVGFITWMPTFLHDKFNFSLARAGFDSTFYHHVAAFLGVMIGAGIADKLAQKIFGVRGIVQMIGLIIGIPFIYIMGKSDSLFIIYAAMAIFGFCRGLYDSNIFAALYDVIEIPYRATATGIMLMFAFIVGSVAPYLLGILKPIVGLSNGLAFLSVGYFFASLCILVALIFFYKRDKI